MSNTIPLPESFLILSRLQSGTEEVCRLDETMAYAAAVSAERDARIEALQTECDASNAEGIELTAQVAALREEVAEVLEQNRKCVFAVNEYNTAIQNLVAERDALRSARIAYANEFPLNADGEPDVGNIHANIRAMKKRIKVLEDALRHVNRCLSINDYGDYVLLSAFDAGIISAALGEKNG